MNYIDESESSDDDFANRPNWVKKKEARVLASLKSNDSSCAVVTQLSQDCSTSSFSSSSATSTSNIFQAVQQTSRPSSYFHKKKSTVSSSKKKRTNKFYS
jgi:hypothetical protein